MTTFSCYPPKGEKDKTSSEERENEKKKQKPTAGVGRRKGGDHSQKRNGH
jgi:hypothetical protein